MSSLKPLKPHFFSLFLAALYKSAITIRNRHFDKKGGIDIGSTVISVGGIHAGGTGKTPLVSFIAGEIAARGHTVCVLSRGYGRKMKESLVIAPGEAAHWEIAGDEPSMLRELHPSLWLGIGKNRAETARMVQRRLSRNMVFILDDGFQHRQLHRTVDIVCLPRNPLDDHCIPAGYMREPLSSLKRAGILCTISSSHSGKQAKSELASVHKMFPKSTPFALTLKNSGWKNHSTGELISEAPDGPYLLFCGIARPQRFIESANIAPESIISKKIFPDHYSYKYQDITSILSFKQGSILTTHKDRCRLGRNIFVPEANLWYLITYVEMENEKTRQTFLNTILT